MRRLLLYLIAATTLTLSCGDSDKETCEKAAKRLCDEACACGQDKCSLGTGNEQGSSVTLNFADWDECYDMYGVMGCMGEGNKELDFQACYDALDDTQCVGTEPDLALDVPAPCQ